MRTAYSIRFTEPHTSLLNIDESSGFTRLQFINGQLQFLATVVLKIVVILPTLSYSITEKNN